MLTDKPTLANLRKFADVFKAAREHNDNESNTVMILIKFFEEVLGYDALLGEITTELPVKDRFCDFAVILGAKTDEGKPKPEFLVEAKAAHAKSLSEKHIEQAYNYAARAPVNWVLLTNGVEWQLYHLTFDANGIQPDLVFNLSFLEKMDEDPDYVWDTLSVLAKSNVQDNSLETYYEQQKLLSPKTIVTTLLGEEVLMKIRQELNRKAPARLDLRDIFHGVMQVLDSEAVAAAGGITPPLKRKKKRRHHQTRADQIEQQETDTLEDPAPETPTTPSPRAASLPTPPATTGI
jgi:predicted type IV restriction endonuclease